MSEDPAAKLQRARAESRRVALPIYEGPDTPARRVTREETFAAMRAAGMVLAGVDALEKLMDALLARVVAAGETPACKSGCSYCCSTYVTSTAPAAMFAVGWARAHLPPETLERVRARAKENAAAARGKDPREYPKQTCAFLVDGSCSIYPARPASCRALYALDVDACRAAWDTRKAIDAPRADVRLDALAQGRAMIEGFREALVHARLDDDLYELQQIVDLLFEDPSAATRWLRGDRDVFAAARPLVDD